MYDNNNNSDSNDDDGDRVCTVRNVHMNRNILIRRFVRCCVCHVLYNVHAVYVDDGWPGSV